MSIKIKTSFLFKNRNLTSQKPNNENSSINKGTAKNTSLINEDDLPSTSLESFKQDELRGIKRKRISYKDTDEISSSEDSSFESAFDEEESPPDSPEFTKQINISPLSESKVLKRRKSVSDEKDLPPSSSGITKQINISPPTENETLKRRQENIKARDAFLASFMNDPEFAEAVQHVGIFKKNNKSDNSSLKQKSRKRKTVSDVNFHTSCKIPLESRKSLRLQCKNPQFSYQDLPNESTFTSRKRKTYNSDDDLDNLEEIVYKPKIKRKLTYRNSERTTFLSVEDVTDSMLENIARKVVEKNYCTKYGTSCHQCRQKTTDTKTFCRSQDCGGVRGQFCGVCLLNRYGEDAAVALKDPNWHCPSCRGICNCSFCRTREGKRPTGILVPQALKAGHKSVKEFLESLRGKGDYIDPTQDPKMLLGFTEDLQYALMGGGHKEFIGTSFNITKQVV